MNIILSGICGKMGFKTYEILSKSKTHSPVCGVDIVNSRSVDIPVYDCFSKIKERADAIIDFSSPNTLDGLISYAVEKKLPVVISTTGHTDKQKNKILKASKTIPVFFSPNMSFGISLTIDLAKKAIKSLPDYDVEIVETHHSEKVDCPSGTALLIANKLAETTDRKIITDRTQKREKNEIGVHSIRGGNVIGTHSVCFFGQNENITITHQITDRSVFSEGAIKAVEFIKDKKCGLFSMEDLLEYKLC